MPTVTYRNQPAIDKTKGNVPLEGTKHPYTVTKVLWPGDISDWISERLVGECLHLCCGLSPLGDVRADLHAPDVDILLDAAHAPFSDLSFGTVLIDPPYNGIFRWNHDMLSELPRLAAERIIFQHWFLPVNRKGTFKKDHAFVLTDVAVWQPRTYFGRVNVLSVFDRTRPSMST